MLFQSIGNLQRMAIAVACAALVTMGPAQSATPMAWVELKPMPSGDMIQIIGHASSTEAADDLDFTMSVKKTNGGNASNTKQGGRFALLAAETKTLSSTAINLQRGDMLTVELKLTRSGQTLASVTLTANGEEPRQTL